MPDSNTKLDMLQQIVQRLGSEGYVFIGMDHFAKPQDELAVALREGRLQRNFQGYSTHADCDLIAVGLSSIGKIGRIYSQNQRQLEAYYADLDAGRLPLFRGYLLDEDDLLRRRLIQDLMCRFGLKFADYEAQCRQPFAQYFAAELADAATLAAKGLLELNETGLTVTPKGRFLIRNIAMVFDRHLRSRDTAAQYSQTV